jgi:energy-coupling factor transport system substrate-specific component
MDSKLKARDLITIGIFSVLFSALYFATVPLGMIPIFYPLVVPIALIPCGIVWAYLRVKVPKRFCILIQTSVFGLLIILMGSGWFAAAGIIVGGFFAEIISGIKSYKSARFNLLGYLAFGIFFHWGTYGIMLFARGYFYEFAIRSGMREDFMDSVLSFMSWPTMLLTSVLALAGAFIGIMLGKRILKKYFLKAGMVQEESK